MSQFNPAQASGVSSKDLKRLSKRVSSFWLRDALLDWMIIVSCFFVIGYSQSLLLVIPMAIIIGNRQHGLSLLGHDGTHYTISYNKKLNDVLTNILTWLPLGITLSGYRNLHNLHHRNLGSEGDPEIHHKRSRAPQWDLPNNLKTVSKYAFLDLFGYSLPDYYIIITYSKPSSKMSYLSLFALHGIFIASTILSGAWWIPALWYGSLCTTFMMFFRLRLWLEHQGTDTAHRLHLNVWQGALFAPHLSWHHWEHHHWPSVPYYSLPELRSKITTEPIVNLKELMKFYRTTQNVKSGTALRLLQDGQNIPDQTSANNAECNGSPPIAA
ncbi:MAG: fatty acid desaturase [Alphaproteobacteria bacterium]|nr:fatty acid desaturase [Alphaproteobacteria bacterium]